MSIFKRLFRIGNAYVNKGAELFEKPIMMTEQGIRDLKNDLNKSLTGLAEIKALSIRAKGEINENTSRAEDYEQKAMLLIQKAENGQIDAAEADRLATEALIKKQEAEENIVRAKSEKTHLDEQIAKMDVNIKRLRQEISKAENELKALKARVTVANATTKLNKQLANVDTDGTMAMIERMKEKAIQKEALAESYGEIANEAKSVDEEIDKALGDTERESASDALAALKAKMKGGNS
ncbi:MAG: PspA/IM30 family protein [Bacteroidetes bacterium]|nr:PspA/IM30 family protein [Bacteroidota bacterium]